MIQPMLWRYVVSMLVFMVIILGYACQTYATPIPNPYTYLNYLEDLKTAANTTSQLTKQAQQLQQAIRMVRLAKQNTHALTGFDWGNIVSALQTLDAITNDDNALSYANTSPQHRFQHDFPNYSHVNGTLPVFGQVEHGWDQATLATLQQTLAAMGQTVTQFQQTQATVARLQAQSQTATGNLASLQDLSELSVQTIQQLQTLQRLLAIQTNASTAYRAARVSQQTYAAKVNHDIAANLPTHWPRYHNNAQFGFIPRM